MIHIPRSQSRINNVSLNLIIDMAPTAIVNVNVWITTSFNGSIPTQYVALGRVHSDTLSEGSFRWENIS